jgi:hypothetical protein
MNTYERNYIKSLRNSLVLDENGDPKLISLNDSGNDSDKNTGYVISNNPILNNDLDMYFDMEIITRHCGLSKACAFALKNSNIIMESESWNGAINKDGSFYDLQEFLENSPDRVNELYADASKILDSTDNVDFFKECGFDSAIFLDRDSKNVKYKIINEYQFIISNQIEKHMILENLQALKSFAAKNEILSAVKNRILPLNISNFAQINAKIGFMAFSHKFTERDPVVRSIADLHKWSIQDSRSFSISLIQELSNWLKSDNYKNHKLLHEVPQDEPGIAAISIISQPINNLYGRNENVFAHN